MQMSFELNLAKKQQKHRAETTNVKSLRMSNFYKIS